MNEHFRQCFDRNSDMIFSMHNITTVNSFLKREMSDYTVRFLFFKLISLSFRIDRCNSAQYLDISNT